MSVKVTIIDDDDYCKLVQLMDFCCKFFSRGDLNQRNFAKRVMLLRQRFALSEKEVF